MSSPTTAPVLVDAIVAQLKAAYGKFDVAPFPDKPENYRLTNQSGAFLVAYRGADYADVKTAGDAVVNARLMLVDIHVVARNLNGPDGALAMIELARTALIGFKVPGFNKMRPGRERFVSLVETLWTYAFTVAAGTLSVEAADLDAGVLATQLTANSPYGASVATS